MLHEASPLFADDGARRAAHTRRGHGKKPLVRPGRFELPTLRLEVSCSIQLSYGRRLPHYSQARRQIQEVSSFSPVNGSAAWPSGRSEQTCRAPVVPIRRKPGGCPRARRKCHGASSRLWREQGYRPSARRGFTAHRPGLGEKRCFQKQKTGNRRTWSRLGRERRAQGPALGERVRRAIRSTCGNVGSRASRKPSFSPKAGRCAQTREIRHSKRRFSPEPGQCSRHCLG